MAGVRRNQRGYNSRFRSARRRVERAKAPRFAWTVALANVSRRPLTFEWRRMPVKFLSAALLAGLLWLLVHFFTSYKFFIYEADIRGIETLTAAEVYAASELEGLSIFYANPQEIAARLEQLPEVARARVHCALPNRVTIEIMENEVDVLWEVGDQRYWVNRHNRIVPYYQTIAPAFTIKELDDRVYHHGEHLDDAVVETAREWHEFFPEIILFYYSPHQQISFLTEEGWVVYVSSAHEAARDVALFKSLRQELQDKGESVEYVDLRYEGRPYYR